MTFYAVMWQSEEGTYDFVYRDLEAGDRDEAARKAAEAAGVGGDFLVFPMRNAEEITVELERVPRGVVRRKAHAE